jgi:hypothetical protein
MHQEELESIKSILQRRAITSLASGRDAEQTSETFTIKEKNGELESVALRMKGKRFDSTKFDVEVSVDFHVVDLTKTNNSRASRK